MSDLSIITPASDEWDAFVATHQDAHILQTAAWGTLKSVFGWTTERVALADGNGTLLAGAQILFRPLPFRLGTMAYIPKGPLAPIDWWSNPAAMQPLWEAINSTAHRQRARWLKVEAPGEESNLTGSALQATNFRPALQGIQPARTVLLDIAPDEDAILKAMKQKTRYNIRLSGKKGVTVREGNRNDLDSFNTMMAVTGGRSDFGVHAPGYYERAFDLFAPSGRAALLIASYEGRDLAGVMVFALGKTAWYFYGASTNEERKRMPAYAVQWAAIQWAKAQGCEIYDLWGVPDADQDTLEAHFQERNDGLWGVYRFKRGFGGRLARQMPAWDRVYNPAIYKLYQLYLKYVQNAANNAG